MNETAKGWLVYLAFIALVFLIVKAFDMDEGPSGPALNCYVEDPRTGYTICE